MAAAAAIVGYGTCWPYHGQIGYRAGIGTVRVSGTGDSGGGDAGSGAEPFVSSSNYKSFGTGVGKRSTGEKQGPEGVRGADVEQIEGP